MALKFEGYIDLPMHHNAGGFDHAAIHSGLDRLYVAHTANDAIDVIDIAEGRFSHSIPDLVGVAGVLVSKESDLVFTSNRAENTVGIFAPNDEVVTKLPVGVRPNGLAYDPGHGLLLAAHVGEPILPASQTVMLIDVQTHRVIATIPVPGRTRWTIYDRSSDAFYVNIADPPLIVAVDTVQLDRIARTFPIAVPGPHGLDMDETEQRLFCACDGGKLVVVDVVSGDVVRQGEISGMPDVLFVNTPLGRLYVAVGSLGVIDVFETRTMQRIETIGTEKGAHTLAFDAKRNRVYAFLPETHRAAVYVDQG